MEREEFKRRWAAREEGYRVVEEFALQEERRRTPQERYLQIRSLSRFSDQCVQEPDAEREAEVSRVREAWTRLREAHARI